MRISESWCTRTSASSLPHIAAAKIYAEQLYPHGLRHGWPLLEPESKVHIGDIGFFQGDTDNFCRLFNVLVEENDPINTSHRGTPEGFTCFEVRKYDWEVDSNFFCTGQPVMSYSVSASKVNFQMTA
jgi:hypothetical protein